ncbi:vomeronasal type-1 receptor 1-like [Phascolarctos cinereus]|uniref:Vomeronasal type-1 receptor n=1 Tax=Phascolarctos cinereus TaxID=38626 RepID=A0A6P5J8Q7_PHACI|nr:vomeronasal type-1 receptor 1-like [Phascolarctos cinereus]
MVLGITFLSLTGVGVLGSSFFLSLCGSTLFTSHKLRPMDPIMVQLALINAIVLLTRGIPVAILYLRTKYFFGDTVCKILFYIQRVSRSLSICITCLLSTFQAIIISPSGSRLAKLKVRAPKYISPSYLLCWILNLLTDINVPISISGPNNSNSSHTHGVKLLYCYWENTYKGIIILPSLRDILFMGCMVWASSYMVLLLYRHHQKVQHVRRTSLSPRISPEMKITRTILLLVGTFISTFSVSWSLTLYKVYMIHSTVELVNVESIIILSFPTISPFLLIHRDLQMPKFC